METIKNYLESMFAHLPNTLEVTRAKDELYSMMEDKYNELINEGKPENEAIGIVISEFGNLEEISESLGINKVVTELDTADRRVITQMEADNYVMDYTKHSFCLSLGILFCILSPIGTILFAPISSALHLEAIEGIGVMLLFILVAIGVGLIIFSSYMMNEWKFLDTELCSIDYATAEELGRQKKEYQPAKGLFLTIGIMLCIISVIPVIFFSMVFGDRFAYFTEALGPSMIFLLAGVGVMFIIFSGSKDAALEKLLSLNDIATVSGNYEPVKNVKKNYSNEFVKQLVASYWKTVLCLYLIISFVTFNWNSTWLIFPIAAILQKPLENMFAQNEEK